MIQPIKELYEEEGNRVSASKKRIGKIKESIGDKCRIDEIFSRLESSLKHGNLDMVMTIIMNELFYEVVSSSFVMDVYKSYINSNDRELFIDKLKESYIIRGIKSARFAWTPLVAH